MATSLSLLSGMALLVALLAALLTSSAAAAAPLSVSAQVDLSLGRHPVSQAIYGTNGAPEYMIQNNLTGSTRMGGGDPTTVYNWKIDADNAGADWYFQQRPRAPDGQTHSAVAFVNASITAGAIAFVDVSIIGYVAVNRSTDCYSFPVSRFPGQTRSSGNMGSGVYPNGSTVASIHGAQLGCYITSGPKDIVAFVAFLIEQFGQEVVERYVVVQFDNEPEWWSAQHQDVHPAPYTYDEVQQQIPTLLSSLHPPPPSSSLLLSTAVVNAVCPCQVWNKMYAHAVALKAAYPKVKISGFVMGGWPGMWCSGVDGASLTNSCPCNDQSPPTHCQDWRAHNKTYLWPYLLQRINAHKVQTGVQLVDYMDHQSAPHIPGISAVSTSHPPAHSACPAVLMLSWYPMFNDMRDDSTALAQAQLLNETRNLYDPTFIDPTGLLDPTTGSTKSAPAIIPRVQQWLKEYAPDCQLGVAITEFKSASPHTHGIAPILPCTPVLTAVCPALVCSASVTTPSARRR